LRERLVFFGRNQGYGVTLRCYRALLRHLESEAHDLVLTVATDDGADEGQTLTSLAEAAGKAVVQLKGNDPNAPEFVDRLRNLEPTLCITVQYPRIFKRALLSVPERGHLNLHRGWPLRGGSIDERAIYFQLPTYHMILHKMVPSIDAGNILGTVAFPLDPEETGHSLVGKADEAGERLFLEVFLPLLGKPIADGDPQDLAETVYGPKNSLDPALDFSLDRETVARKCRAFHHPRKLGAWWSERGIYLPPPIEAGDGIAIAVADGHLIWDRGHRGDLQWTPLTELLKESQR